MKKALLSLLIIFWFSNCVVVVEEEPIPGPHGGSFQAYEMTAWYDQAGYCDGVSYGQVVWVPAGTRLEDYYFPYHPCSCATQVYFYREY